MRKTQYASGENMQIEQGILIPSTIIPVGEGVTGASHAIVNITGISQRCVVKPAGTKEISAECFCALLGYFLGLPVLNPVIVSDPRDSTLWFGARNVGYPSLSTACRITNPPTEQQLSVLAVILSTWIQAPSIISFDELIENGDRNPGNILWNGSIFTIIDHERCLGIEPKIVNKLALFALSHSDQARLAIMQQGITSAAISQQAMVGVDQIWDKIEQEFDLTPNSIQQEFSAFKKICQANAKFLINTATTALAPLFAHKS